MTRSWAPFLQGMARLEADAGTGDGRFAVMTLSWFRDDAPQAARAALVAQRQELANLGIDIPAGVDPDGRAQSLVRSFGAPVGSAHCLVLDRTGAPAWFLQDPRGRDVALLERVVERLVGD